MHAYVCLFEIRAYSCVLHVMCICVCTRLDVHVYMYVDVCVCTRACIMDA